MKIKEDCEIFTIKCQLYHHWEFLEKSHKQKHLPLRTAVDISLKHSRYWVQGKIIVVMLGQPRHNLWYALVCHFIPFPNLLGKKKMGTQINEVSLVATELLIVVQARGGGWGYGRVWGVRFRVKTRGRYWQLLTTFKVECFLSCYSKRELTR